MCINAMGHDKVIYNRSKCEGQSSWALDEAEEGAGRNATLCDDFTLKTIELWGFYYVY